jgi:glyoxylase-like metal-dependent hydrolase (beta-lactamase superfamily II)
MSEPQLLADGVVRLGTSKVNWYLVADDSGVTVVDAGLSGLRSQLEPGLEMLGRSLDDVRAFLLTHGDADHTGVAGKMQREGDDTPVHLHPDDEYLVHGGRKKTEDPMLGLLLKPGALSLFAHFARYGGANPPKIERTVALSDGQTVDVPGRPQVIHTPGHTEGHVVFHFPAHGAVFVGDTICTWHPISGERGPQPMAFNVSNATALNSLSRYEGLDAALVLVGHGEPWSEGPAAAVERARAKAAGLRPVDA